MCPVEIVKMFIIIARAAAWGGRIGQVISFGLFGNAGGFSNDEARAAFSQSCTLANCSV
jgi:hypothetical protein